MEIFKVNSAELIEGAGVNEDVFSALNAPESNNVFSLQRFAVDVTLRQQSGDDSKHTSTMIAGTKFGEFLAGYTLGRSTDTTNLATAISGKDNKTALSFNESQTYITIAPLRESTTSGSEIISNTTSYSLTAYQVDASNVRVAISAQNFTPYSATSEVYDYILGVSLLASSTTTQSTTYAITTPSGNSPVAWSWHYDSATHSTADYYEALIPSGTTYGSLYFPMGTYQGLESSGLGVFAVSKGVTYTFDGYDITLQSDANYANSANVVAGSYVFKSFDKPLYFNSEASITFDGIETNESETYVINGVSTTFVGTADATATMTVGAYTGSSATAQTFTLSDYSSDVSVKFNLTGLGSNTGIYLNNSLYKSGTDSGTVVFGKTSGTTASYITLGESGSFVMNAASDVALYNLETGASGTFGVAADKTLVLDLDGAGTAFNPMTFTAAAAATVTAVFSNTGVTLAGQFSNIAGSGTDIYNLVYTFTDGAVANIGAYSFSDTKKSSNTIVTFANTSGTSIVLAGPMSVGLTDTSATAAFAHGTMFTLSNTGTYQLNGQSFLAAGGGDSKTNLVSFISTGLTYADAHSGTSYADLVSSSVTGFSLGASITAVSSLEVPAGSAMLFGNTYVGASGGKVTVTTNDSSTKLEAESGLIQISGVSGTELVGISDKTFDLVTGATYSFYLADGGTGTKITNVANTATNAITFSETEDETISKLVISGQINQFDVTGKVALTSGTDIAATYTLHDYTGKTSGSSVVDINGIEFSGSEVGVANVNGNTYSLINPNVTYSITGSTTNTTRVFNFDADQKGVFDFGAIHINLSTDTIKNGSSITIDSGMTLASNTAISALGIGTEKLAIADGSTGSDSYSVYLTNEGKVDYISNIDSGATLTAVAGATYVLTTEGSETGIYTFNSAGSGTQIFQISTDINGVKFVLDSDGVVQSIEGIDNATVNITDTTIQSGTNAAFTKTYNTADNTYVRNADGTWGNSNYLGYIVNQSAANTFTVDGIESGTLAHTTSDKVIGTSGTQLYTISSGTITTDVSVAFQNSIATVYEAKVDGDTATSLFTNLASTGSNGLGVLVSMNSDTSDYELSVTHGLNTSGEFASSTAKTDIVDTISLKLGEVPLTAYNGFVVSGNGAGATINSSAVTLDGSSGSTTYVSMSEDAGTDAVVVFANTNDRTYNINEVHQLVVNKYSTGSAYSAVGSNTDIFSLNVTGNGAYVQDTISTDISINGITYGLADEGGSATVKVTAGTSSDTALITGGMVAVAGSDVGVFAKTNIAFTADTATGLVFDVATYTAAAAATYSLSEVSGTQYATVANGTIQIAFADSEAVVFDNAVYTTTSQFAFTRTTGTDSDVMVSGTATGVTAAGEKYVAYALGSNTYVLDSDSGKIITYNADAPNGHGYDVSYNKAKGEYEVVAGSSFSIADAFLGESATASALTYDGTDVYVYTVGEGGAGSLYLTLDESGNALISASGSTIVGTRTTSDTSTEFTLSPEGMVAGSTDTFTYKISEGTATFAFNSDVTVAAGKVWEATGTRAFAAGDADKFATDAAIFGTLNSDVYTPDAGATMTVVVSSGVGTETFTGGSATFTAETGDVFHFAMGEDINEYTATTDVTLSANFTSGTGQLLSANGAGTRQGDGTYLVEALSDTYVMGSDSSIQLTLNGSTEGTESFIAGTGTFTDTQFHISDEYLGQGGTGTDVYVYTADGGASNLTLTLDGTETTIALGTTKGTRKDTDTGVKFSFTLDSESNSYVSTSALTFEIDSDVKVAAGNLYEGTGIRTLDKAGTANDTATLLEDVYTAALGATMTLVVEAGLGTETFTEGSATYVAAADSDVFHFTLDGATNVYSATGEGATLTAYFKNATDGTLIDATGTGARFGSDTMVVLGDTYSMGTDSTIQLTLKGTSGTETLVAGTGTFSGDTFHVSDKYLGLNDGNEKAYEYQGTGVNLTLNLKDSETAVIDLGTTTGTRKDTDTGVFEIHNATYTALTDLTFQISGSSTSAAGNIYEGTGTRTLVGEATANDTATLLTDVYTAAEGAIMTIEVKDGVGTETFTSGSATFTAAAGDVFHFAIGADTNAYTATASVELSAYFNDATDGKLIDATGTGTRTGSGDYEIAALEQTYKMDSDSSIELTLEGTSGTETFVDGTGTFAVEKDATFKVTAGILGEGVKGEDVGDILVYSATTAGNLTLTLDSGTQTIALTDDLEGIRKDTEETIFTFAEQTYTITDSNLTVFKITGDNASATSALGEIYSAVGTRESEEGDDLSGLDAITFNADEYTAISGTIQLKLDAGVSETSLINGTAAYTATESALFHFNGNAYTAIEDGAELQINVDYQAAEGEESATLLAATGKGVRDINDGETFAIEALDNNVYTFSEGTAQIELNITEGDTSSFVETAYSGNGTFEVASGDSATVQFDADNSATGTVYSYIAGDDGATFEITLEDGNVATQSIKEGSATREGTDEDETFQFEYDGEYRTYSTTSTAESTEQGELTFVLNNGNQAVAGAAGTLYQGVGYRSAEDGEEIVSPYSNTYTLSTSDEYRLTVADGEVVGDGEEIFHVSAEKTIAEGDTFTFDGTQYTAVDGEVTLQLSVENAGQASETGVSGIGEFSTTNTEESFTYNGNEYYVDGEKGAFLRVTFPDSQNAEFVEGAGNRDLAEGESYHYTDSNTYVMESDGQAYIEVDEESNVVQNLNSGTGTATFDSGKEFVFTYEDEQNTYTATDEGATLQIYGKDLNEGGATVAFTEGAATRTADGEGAEFEYESNTYTAEGEVTYMLSIDGETDEVTEKITAGTGTRGVEDNVFTYTSVIDSNNYAYTAEGAVTLRLTLDETGGTETLIEGAGTRALAEGETFSYTTQAFETEDEFTVTEEGTYKLEAISEDSGLLAMGYNTDAVTETLVNVTATTDKEDAFSYTSVVTSEVVGYTPVDGAVTFQLNITDGEESVTWLAGSATMLLESGAEFSYTAENVGDVKSYTAGDEGVTFTRISEDTEYMSAGTATREVEDGDSATVVFLDQEFTASAGTMLLSVADGDTVANEVFDSGEATFTRAEGEEFNYALSDGTSHTYTATADVTMVVDVEAGSATRLSSAEGSGIRALEEATSTTLFDADVYEINEGVLGITLGDDAQEELVSATGVFEVESGSEFHVNDAVLGAGDDAQEYAYTAGDEGATLTLTIADGSNTVAIESGLGIRTDEENPTFEYNGETYEVSSGTVEYAISAESQTSAAGFLYNAVGTREGEDSTTFVFQEDEYTAENGTFRLTVTEGVSEGEEMIAGTATYTADTDAIFHYDYEGQGLKAYTATAVTSLEAVFEMDEEGNPQVIESSIEGSGLRYAEDGEEFSTSYQEDTYTAVADATKILLDATDSENIFETIGGGQVINEVSADDTFHYAPNGEWYEYTAGNDVTITLDMDNDNEMSFSDDPYATRITEGEDFEFEGKTYSADGEETTYLLTGSGTSLAESVYSAAGSREVEDGEEYTSALENVYTLTEGTYNIVVEEGAGTETLTVGSGTAEIAAGNTFKYGDDGVEYTANVEGATLDLTIDSESETEVLSAGAGFDGESTYIAVDGAKVALAGTSGSTLNAVAEDAEQLVTLTADETSGLTAVENSGDFTADFDADGTLKVNNRDFTALTGGSLGISSGLDSFTADSDFTAEGDFSSGSPALSGGTVEIAEDTDIAVVFGADGVSSIGKLSDGAEVNAAAGAAKAVTDAEGTFVFNNEPGQTFEIEGDSEVTFQLDENGIVTGIAGITQGTTFNITDGNWASEVSVDELGKVLTRNEDGSWASADVVAEKYIVDVTSDGTLVVSAVDSQGDLTQVNNDAIGTANVGEDAITINVNSEIIDENKPIIVTNNSGVENHKSIAFTGAVNVGLIELTDGGAAIQIDSDTAAVDGAFKTGTLSGNDFVDGDKPYTITGGSYGIDASGNATVGAETSGNSVNVSVKGGELTLGAENTSGAFTVNDGPEITLAIGADDEDGLGLYGVVLDSAANTVSGLTPNGVQTGTVVVPTGDEEVTFAIGDAAVTVTSDDGSMTIEIKDDALCGLSDIATNATIEASGVDALAINGDTDNTVAVSGDPIKYNETDEKWLTGDAEAKDATAYLVSVTAENTVELYFTDADNTELKKTTNRADYVKVFGEDVAPESDGAELPNYGGSLTLLNEISDTSVSVATGNEGVVINMSDDNVVRELVLVTADGVYNINEQEIIPSGEVTVSALGTSTAYVDLNSDVTVAHGSMSFTADNSASATFSESQIILTDSAKVTNTDADQNFSVFGNVTFDEIAVVADTLSGAAVSNVNATVAPSGLTVDEKELNVTGGDVAYTVNVAGDIPTIIGINGDATLTGELVENAEIQTASSGNFVIADSAFTIAGDEAVTFKTSDSSVTAISELTGTATGNFGNGVQVDTGAVVIIGDEVVAVTADGTIATAIDGVGADDAVTLANTGGATVVNTDKNGEFLFGASSINSQRYVVKDEDDQVSFSIADLRDFTPSVTAVSGLNNGFIAIGQDDTVEIDGVALTLGAVSNDVTINASNSQITSVDGLEGSINGLASDTAVQVVDDNATINGQTIAISEDSGNTTIVATAADTGYSYVSGLNKDAVVNIAANVSIKTEEEGAFTFPNGTFTISGDSEVTFVTDAQSRVIDIADFNGTLQMTASEATVNGAPVAVAMGDTDSAVSDVTIASSGSGVDSILGLGNGDSVTVPAGTDVVMPGSSDTDTTTTLTVNGKEYELEGDTDTVVITAGTPDSISGLNAGASLTFKNTAGNYNVNNTPISAGVGSKVIGDEEGTAHIYDPNDVDITENDTTADVVNKLTGSNDVTDEDRYVESLDSDAAEALATAMASGDMSGANGNIKMTLSNNDTSTAQTADFSNTTGIKKVTMEGEGEQNVAFNDAGGNIAIVEDDSSGTTAGTKNIQLGDGGDVAVVGNTGAPVNITAGAGNDSIVTQGRNTSVDLSKRGATRMMATGLGEIDTGDTYDHTTGAGIQLTNNNIKEAIRKNTVVLENGLVTTNSGKGAKVRTNAATEEGSSIVNFYNLKGLMTKVGYTHNEGGTVDLSTEKGDVVMKGNYQQNGAQKKSGSSVLKSGSGDDYILGGAGDDIDAGEGNNEIELDGTTRSNADAGATLTQSATRGTTKVTGFNNEFGNTGDKVNISPSAAVKFVNGVLRFTIGAAQLILDGIKAYSSGSADLAESADDVGSLSVNHDFAPVIVNDGKLAVASEGNWIGGDESMWSEENMPAAYIGSGSGIDFSTYDGAVNITLSGAGENTSAGTLGEQEVALRGISQIQLGNNTSTVVGSGEVNNTVVAGEGSSSVWGGGASADTFIGKRAGDGDKFGASTFFFLEGDNKDTITNFEFLSSENAGTADKINVLGTELLTANVSGDDVVVLNTSNDNDRLTLKHAIGQDFQIEYGEVDAYQTVTAQVAYDSLNFDNRANYYQAVNKNASVIASSELTNGAEIWLNNQKENLFFEGDIKYLDARNVEGNATLVGNSNDNLIYASNEKSSMWGGNQGGNDTLVGGEGADWFWYGKNNGNDNATSVNGDDTVNLYDINLDDLAAADIASNTEVNLTLKDGSNFKVQGNITAGTSFRLEDGSTWIVDSNTGEWAKKE